MQCPYQLNIHNYLVTPHWAIRIRRRYNIFNKLRKNTPNYLAN